MFYLAPEQVVVMTDTLATNMAGEPYLLVSKCAVVPHLNMIIAGTGAGQLGSRWVQTVSERTACLDIEMLDTHAPVGIARLWDALLAEEDHRYEGTSTIYHFGRSEATQKYVGYAYRSVDGFASEPLRPYGFAAKPPPLGSFEPSTDLRDWIKLAEQIRAEQDPLPHGERVYIGGALICAILQGGAINVSEVYRFDDFDATWEDLNTRLA